MRRQGFIDSQIYWRTSLSGRFSYHVNVNIFELIGQGIVRFLPFSALVIRCAATAWTIYQIALAFRWPLALAGSFLLASVTDFATLNSAPGIVQPLYGQTGMLSCSLLKFLTSQFGPFAEIPNTFLKIHSVL